MEFGRFWLLFNAHTLSCSLKRINTERNLIYVRKSLQRESSSKDRFDKVKYFNNNIDVKK